MVGHLVEQVHLENGVPSAERNELQNLRIASTPSEHLLKDLGAENSTEGNEGINAEGRWAFGGRPLIHAR